jgi:glycosyltransferase involved in cell wall biosynthesis
MSRRRGYGTYADCRVRGERVKILVVTREFPPHVLGGISYHLAHLYTGIVGAGHDVTVVTGVASEAATASEATDLVHADITTHAFRYGRMAVQHLTFPIALRRFLRSFDLDPFDVAMTHTPLPFELPLPTIGKYHDCFQEERRYFREEIGPLKRTADSLLNPTRRYVERRSLSTVDHAIFNSRLCRRAWESHYRVSTPRSVVYNGVNAELFRPRASGPPEEYALFVGDSERKGLSRVERLARTSAVPIYVVGDVSLQGEHVRTLGRVAPDRLAELYSGAVATVHPAKFEAFGNVVLESLACGTPVVTTSSCGASEILTDACGVVDEPLETGIETCRTLSARDCVAVANEYTWERTVDRTLNVIDRVV